jgi:hypothetical protein
MSNLVLILFAIHEEIHQLVAIQICRVRRQAMFYLKIEKIFQIKIMVSSSKSSIGT